MKPVSSLSRASVLLVFLFILSLSTTFADEGSLEWYYEYQGGELEHIALSGCFDSGSNLVVSTFIDDTNNNANDRWVVLKFDQSGTLLWEIDLPTTSTPDYKSCTTADNEGNVFVAASVYLQGSGVLTQVYKLAPDGSTIWHTTHDTTLRTIKGLFYREDGYLVSVGHSDNWSVITQYAADDMMGQVWWDAEIDSIDGNSLVDVDFAELDNSNRLTLVGRANNGTYNGVGWVRLLDNGIQDVSGTYFNESSAVYFEGAADLDDSGKLFAIVGINEPSSIKLLGINVDGTFMWESTIEGFIHSDNRGAVVLDQGNPVVAIRNHDHTVLCAEFTSDTGSESWSVSTTSMLRSIYPGTMTIGDDSRVYLAGNSNSVAEPHAVIRMLPQGDGEEWAFYFGNTDTFGSRGGWPGFFEFNNGALIGASTLSASYTVDQGMDVYRVESVTSSAPETGIDLLPTEMTVDTYPNPFNATVNIKLNLPVRGDVKIRLVNMLGQTVYESQENIGNRSHTISLNAEDFPSGMYLLEATDRNGTRVSKRVTLLK